MSFTVDDELKSSLRSLKACIDESFKAIDKAYIVSDTDKIMSELLSIKHLTLMMIVAMALVGIVEDKGDEDNDNSEKSE